MSPHDIRVYAAFLPPAYVVCRGAAQEVASCATCFGSARVPSRWSMLDHSTSVAPDQRIVCLCQYNGAAFSGWERKPAVTTVQDTIERAISTVCGKSVSIAGASKTDAGTHSIGQVFHFDPPPIFSNGQYVSSHLLRSSLVNGQLANTISMLKHFRLMSKLSAWSRALNTRLPNDILILEANHVPLSFHARKSAVWRRYRYTILTSKRNSVFLSPFVWHLYQKPLNVTRMNAAAQKLRCHHPNDFSAFRKARSSAAHTNILLHDISVRRASNDPNLLEIEVCASWFVYGMMRLLTAALVDVGWGALTVDEFYDIFRFRQRHRIKHSAPANGLCLLEVGYPSEQNPFTSSEQLRNSSHVSLGLSTYAYYSS